MILVAGEADDHIKIPDATASPESVLRSALREGDREDTPAPPDQVRVSTEEPL